MSDKKELLNNIITDRDLLTIQEWEVKKYKIQSEFEKIKKQELVKQELEKLSFTDYNEEYIKLLQQKTEQAFQFANKKMRILPEVPEFSDMINFVPGELILVGAKTGSGKTTFAVNVAYGLLLQDLKILYITNEENAVDTVHRIGSLFLARKYNNAWHNIDQEIKQKYLELIPKIASRIHIIDADFGINLGLNNLPSLTNTIEGFTYIVDRIITEHQNGKHYDAIIIDYYQKINVSLTRPNLTPFEVQNLAAEQIERLRQKNIAPIIVMAQVNPESTGKDFMERIQGRKILVNFATTILELIVDRSLYRTEVKVHKARNSDIVYNQKLYLGWHYGKYVRYDGEFIKRIQQLKLADVQQRIHTLINPSNNNVN